MKRILYFTYILVASAYFTVAQETLNAFDPNTFILGGDQKSVTGSIELLPLAIIDIEPEGGAVGGGALTDLEAGLPATGGTGGIPENLWINFTFRSLNYQPARIFVATNQPVPAGMTIKVEIIETGTDGDFPKNPRFGQVPLSQTEEVIVYDFANGYTGDGVNKGYHLKYTVDNPGGASLPAGFQIVYRIG